MKKISEIIKSETVTENRNEYIGGSDMPIILNLSKYKTRFELLLEKLGEIENDFEGNQYTEFGNEMEPKIREFINELPNNKDSFKEECLVVESEKVRCNADGVNKPQILEIKTSTKPNLENKAYLAQLLFYMIYFNKNYGLLAVYENSEFNTTFNSKRLAMKSYSVEEIEKLLGYTVDDIKKEVAKFWADFGKLKSYQDLGIELTQDLIIDNQIELLSNRVVELEKTLKEFKKIEKEQKELKEQLYQAMKENNVKKWEMPNGTKITRVDEQNGTTIKIDMDRLKSDIDLSIYEYEEPTHKKGYLLIK